MSNYFGVPDGKITSLIVPKECLGLVDATFGC